MDSVEKIWIRRLLKSKSRLLASTVRSLFVLHHVSAMLHFISNVINYFRLRVPPGCNTEFSASGWAFLVQLFEQHDKDKDGALNTQELASLFSPCSIMPWGQNLKYSVPTNAQVIMLSSNC